MPDSRLLRLSRSAIEGMSSWTPLRGAGGCWEVLEEGGGGLSPVAWYMI